jgi:hypothetical protein
MFDPVIIGVVEQTKGALLQTNPQLARTQRRAARSCAEFAPRRRTETEAAKPTRRASRSRAKDCCFYKSPLGKKMSAGAAGLDETFTLCQQWPRGSAET